MINIFFFFSVLLYFGLDLIHCSELVYNFSSKSAEDNLNIDIPEHLKGISASANRLREFYNTYVYPNRNAVIESDRLATLNVPSLDYEFHLINRNTFDYNKFDKKHDVLLRFFHTFLSVKPKIMIDLESLPIWSMPHIYLFNLQWHVGVFKQLIPMKFIGNFRECIDESDLLDYFVFILSSARVASKLELWALIGKYKCVELFMDYGLVTLIQLALEYFSDTLSEAEGFQFMLHHSKAGWNRINSNGSILNWQKIAVEIIKRFPNLVYRKEFHCLNKNGDSTYSNAIFLHFGPIIRLLHETVPSSVHDESGLSTWSQLDDFALYKSGNVRNAVSMGTGGLIAIDHIIKISKINYFYDGDDFRVKNALFNRFFNLFFPSLEPVSIAFETFLNSNAVSLSESLLIYYNCFISDKEKNCTLTKILETAIKFAQKEEERDITPILAVISYLNLSEIRWGDLIEKYIDASNQNQQDQRQDQKEINFAEIAYLIYKCTERISSCRHQQNQNQAVIFKITDLDSDFGTEIDEYCDAVYSEPLQLDVMRIILARKFGIPVEETRYCDFTDESMEWSEALGFLNFHIERKNFS